MSLPDLRALLVTLSQAEVRYVVIGGIALGLHGGLRTTEDLDIVPDPDPGNLDRLCRVLGAEGAMLLLKPSRSFGAREAWLLRRGHNVSLTTRHGDLDIVRRLAGVPDYARLAHEAERYEVDGTTISVASPTQLIEMKLARGSTQDAADIDTLRMIEEQDRRDAPGER
jgi:hypothetical protein